MSWKTNLILGAALLGAMAGGAEARDLTVTSWGGNYQDAQREVYFEPFSNKTGTKLGFADLRRFAGDADQAVEEPIGIICTVPVIR